MVGFLILVLPDPFFLVFLSFTADVDFDFAMGEGSLVGGVLLYQFDVMFSISLTLARYSLIMSCNSGMVYFAGS